MAEALTGDEIVILPDRKPEYANVPNQQTFLLITGVDGVAQIDLDAARMRLVHQLAESTYAFELTDASAIAKLLAEESGKPKDLALAYRLARKALFNTDYRFGISADAQDHAAYEKCVTFDRELAEIGIVVDFREAFAIGRLITDQSDQIIRLGVDNVAGLRASTIELARRAEIHALRTNLPEELEMAHLIYVTSLPRANKYLYPDRCPETDGYIRTGVLLHDRGIDDTGAQLGMQYAELLNQTGQIRSLVEPISPDVRVARLVEIHTEEDQKNAA